MMEREVVVTGIGLVTPLESGRGVEEFWELLLKGTCRIGAVDLFDTSPYPCSVGAEVKGFGGVREGGDRWLSFLEGALTEALSDSKLQVGATDAARTGVVVGTILGGVLGAEPVWRSGKGKLPESYHLQSGARMVADRLGAAGPVTTVSTACASGTDAIGTAARLIGSGAIDVAVAGGADTLSEFAFSGFSSLDALTKSVVRPFDKDRDGLALGEGACLLVLEERKRAEKRGAGIYGRVAGYASSADANHMTGPDREGGGLARAMEGALRGWGGHGGGARTVDYINVHGTGTPYNDLMETKAVKRVFGEKAGGERAGGGKASAIPLSSIKSMLGHSFGAAGAVEAVACLLAIKHGYLPPTVNLTTPDPDCDLDCVPGEAREGKFKSALSLSAGFGGQNGVLLITEI